MQQIKQDLLAVRQGIIVHQVNCRGVMGAGVALAIRLKWPQVFEAYQGQAWRPGMLQLVCVDANAPLYVCNLAGQDGCGRSGCHTLYPAVREGFRKLDQAARELALPVYISHGMGCSLAGGDWPTYLAIVEEECPGVVVCKYQGPQAADSEDQDPYEAAQGPRA